jgi:hypothetical protein
MLGNSISFTKGISMFKITSKGDHGKTKDFLHKLQSGDIFSNLEKYGAAGVSALARATPVDTGLTQQSWSYIVIRDKNHPGIEWHNTNVVNGTPVAILIQYGHGTGTGGYVQGRDFINPAMRPIFDKIADDVWEEVTRG